MNSLIYKKVSEELGIEEKVVKKAYESFWEFIKTTISSLPLSDNLTYEEFKQLRTNFNIPSIGKLSCTYEKYSKVKKAKEYKYGRVKSKVVSRTSGS